MNRFFKHGGLVVILIAHFSSFGMNRVDQLPDQERAIVCSRVAQMGKKPVALPLERAYCHFNDVAKAAHTTKLLEHSCFAGESLRFQAAFFSSHYMDLPQSIASPFFIITRDVSIDPRRFVFEYHGYYRRTCKDLIESFIRAIGKKSALYDRHIQKLFDRPDGVEQFRRINRMRYDDLVPQKEVCLNMIEAYDDNHYPMVLKLYQQYCDMPKQSDEIPYRL